MRQISMSYRCLDGRAAATFVLVDAPRDRQARSGASDRDGAAITDRAERGNASGELSSSPFARSPAAGATASRSELLRGRLRRELQHDLCAPPAATVVALGLVYDQARRLEVVEPPLHAPAVRTHVARPRSAPTRHRSPAHDRCESDDELGDRRRVARRAARVPEPEQVALHRVHPRLQPIVAGRDAAARGARPTEQRANDRAARFGRQRLDRRPVPTAARRGSVQRHRQRQRRGAARSSSLANGRSRRSWEAPGSGRTRSIRRTARVRKQCICGLRRKARQGRGGR